MKNLVIFASHINNPNHISIGKEIINLVNKHVPNNKIYVGVNNSCKEWFDEIKYLPHEETPNNLLVKSDASAYQTALRLFDRLSKEEDYDNVFFLHSQGTKSGRHDVRKNHLNTLLVEYDNAVRILHSEEKNGIYGATFSPVTRYSFTEPNSNDIWYTLDKYYDFPYRPFQYFYIGTMFVMKYKILKNFLNNCKRSFFDSPLSTVHNKDPNKTDLWFFERDFPQIVFRQGYLPTYKFLYNNYCIKNFGKDDSDIGRIIEFKKDLANWQRDNLI